jgi:hypothetical protein
MARDWDHTTDKINRGVPFERQPGADRRIENERRKDQTRMMEAQDAN